MRTGAVVCFVFTALGLIGAVNVVRAHEPDENIVSYTVGAFWCRWFCWSPV
jgi:hypothetical protein